MCSTIGQWGNTNHDIDVWQGAAVQEGPLVMPEEKKLHTPTKYALGPPSVSLKGQQPICAYTLTVSRCTRTNPKILLALAQKRGCRDGDWRTLGLFWQESVTYCRLETLFFAITAKFERQELGGTGVIPSMGHCKLFPLSPARTFENANAVQSMKLKPLIHLQVLRAYLSDHKAADEDHQYRQS